MTTPPGWYQDPWAPIGVRWWDGAAWTGHAALPVVRTAPPRPPHPTLPVQAAVGAVGVLLASLIASRFLLRPLAEYEWPIAAYVGIAGVLGYGPVIWWCAWASRRWGTGRVRDDTGSFVRWSDAGWGPVTWLACVAAQVVVGVVVVLTDIPITSNTEGVDDLSADRGYVVSLLVLAVVAAPLVEEVVFRGVVLRGLLERMGVVAAVAVQAVLFGLAHVDPVRGVGNVGLVLVLSGVGAVLGGAAYLFRRIGPVVIAHAIINAVAMTIALSGWSPDG